MADQTFKIRCPDKREDFNRMYDLQRQTLGSAPDYLEIMEKPGAGFSSMVAEYNGNIIGYMIYRLRFADHRLHAVRFITDPRYDELGIENTLMEALEERVLKFSSSSSTWRYLSVEENERNRISGSFNKAVRFLAEEDAEPDAPQNNPVFEPGAADRATVLFVLKNRLEEMSGIPWRLVKLGERGRLERAEREDINNGDQEIVFQSVVKVDNPAMALYALEGFFDRPFHKFGFLKPREVAFPADWVEPVHTRRVPVKAFAEAFALPPAGLALPAPT